MDRSTQSRELPLVSVVMPVYNGERYLREAIDSVLSQEGVRVELVVVDDGSTDGSPGIIKEYSGRITSIWQPNSRQAVAQNNAIRNSVGEYVAYLDSDDVCLPGRLRRQVDFLEKNPDFDLVYCATEYIDSEGNTLMIKIPKEPDPLRLLYLNDVPHSAVMHRRGALERVGLFDETYPNQDWDLWVRFSEVSRLGLLPLPLVKYREHPANLTNSRKGNPDHYRWTRMMLLKKTLERRGNPFWLRLAYLRAILEWRIFSCALLRGLSPRLWWRGHYVMNLLEQRVLSVMFGGETMPECWKVR